MASQLQIGQELGLMNRQEGLYRLEFHHQAVLHQNIQPEPRVQPNVRSRVKIM